MHQLPLDYAIILLMAEHKVPQDVEADDKLIGPFSFRQFVYPTIATAFGFLAFILGRLAIPLALIPAPVCLFFLVIALPLRKDQPTEIYLAALIKYYFKTRVRVWQADGEQPLVEISNPTTDDTPRTKDLAGDEVSRRLSFLANLSDTQGWSTRGVSAPVNNTNLTDEFANDAVNAQDVMDDSNISSSIDHLLDQSERKVRQRAIDQMNQAMQQQQSTPAQPQPVVQATGQVLQTSVQTVVPQTGYQATSPTPAAPNLATTTSLPTYDYNSIIQPSPTGPNFQTLSPQPMHNRQLQSLRPTITPIAGSTIGQFMAQSQPQLTVSNQPTQPSQPAQPVQQPAAVAPAPSAQPATTTPSSAPTSTVASQPPVAPAVNTPIAPAAPTAPLAPTINQPALVSRPADSQPPAKPAIIDNDNVHQPVVDAPADDSIIDIKLH